MLQLSYDEIVDKIKENSGLSSEEISEKIKNKLENLQGLVSKEGAAHIVANELGLKIFDQPSGKVKIDQIRVGMRDLSITGRLVRKFDVREFQKGERSGKVGNIILGDETGTIRAALWGSIADEIEKINENDVVVIESAYAKENRGEPEIHLNDKSKLIINPQGLSVGEVSKEGLISSSIRKQISDISEGDRNIEIVATIVQTFDPRFFETCPECNKRARMRGEGNYFCEEHGTVSPNYAYLINLVIDDGTSNIRTVFFREKADALSKKSHEEFMALKENPDETEKLKHDLLGQMIKIIANVKKNEMFDRIELIANEVFVDLDPDKEIAAIDKELEKARSIPTIQNLTEKKEEPSTEPEKSQVAENPVETSVGETPTVAEKKPEDMNEDEAINKILEE